MKLRTCVRPNGKFVFGIHKPTYQTENFRLHSAINPLGHFTSGEPHLNSRNYPEGEIEVQNADWIYEIPNPFSFRGTTYIDKEWAEAKYHNQEQIGLPAKEELSFSQLLTEEAISDRLFAKLPVPLLLALATTSTDPADLITLAELSCDFEKDQTGKPTGLIYTRDANNKVRALIKDFTLFEATANNPALPAAYQRAMVLRPGAQGASEIVGEYEQENTHVYEYLRRNSYIAHGHYAANMADNAIRYSIEAITNNDMAGLRHLYYQRSFTRLAELCDIPRAKRNVSLNSEELEQLRLTILKRINEGVKPEFTSTLWGWNFGFDFAPTNYRLHASHQQVHQQYAMLPETVPQYTDGTTACTENLDSFGCGDMVAEVIQQYKKETGNDFFTDYIKCIRNNSRMDGRKEETAESSLILWEDKHALLFVPKAQTSQWELQLLALYDDRGSVIGNIVEANSCARDSLDLGIFLAQKALAGLGARMVTSIEYSRRISERNPHKQHLLYTFLPRLPESPGAFSEAQLRYINGHYPEDFAAACRQVLSKMRVNAPSCSCDV